jgi:nucleoside phosphorylase
MAAVMGMLDELHEDSGRRQRDDNNYVVGRLAGHNCVLACLPVGVYGTTSATSVASEMRFTFPSIEFWLLVGIGGGVPSRTNDIRLGDVVVGVPSPKHDGVIQYDYGKTLAEGKFIRTGSMNKPPITLLTAISKLQAETRTQGRASISDMVSNMIAQHPTMRLEYSYQGPDRDILFNAEYQHVAEHDCAGCDLDNAVQRPTRDSDHSKVHYGPIASGN